MKKTLQFLFAMLLLFGSILSFGQRGLPPKERTSTRHITKYAQHLDFLP